MNKKLNLIKDESSKIKKYKIPLVCGIFFILGFTLAPKGISEVEYSSVVKGLEDELVISEQLVDDLSNKLIEAKVFLELDEDNKKNVIDNISEIKAKQEEERKAKQLEEEKKKAEELEKQEAKKEANITNLFKDIYVRFAPNVGESLYQNVKQVIASSGYKYDLTEPSQEEMGKLKIYDKLSDDSISMVFYPKNDMEILSLVQYDRGNNAISASTDLHIQPLEYSIYDGTNKTTYSIEEQIEFIFSE